MICNHSVNIPALYDGKVLKFRCEVCRKITLEMPRGGKEEVKETIFNWSDKTALPEVKNEAPYKVIRWKERERSFGEWLHARMYYRLKFMKKALKFMLWGRER